MIHCSYILNNGWIEKERGKIPTYDEILKEVSKAFESIVLLIKSVAFNLTSTSRMRRTKKRSRDKKSLSKSIRKPLRSTTLKSNAAFLCLFQCVSVRSQLNEHSRPSTSLNR